MSNPETQVTIPDQDIAAIHRQFKDTVEYNGLQVQKKGSSFWVNGKSYDSISQALRDNLQVVETPEAEVPHGQET